MKPITHQDLADQGIELLRLSNKYYLLLKEGCKGIRIQAAWEGQAMLQARKIYNF